MNRLGNIETAAGFVLSLIAGLLGLAGWAFSTFETKEAAGQSRDAIERRLERIENKLDRAMEYRQGR
jgi:hypothetical protein